MGPDAKDEEALFYAALGITSPDAREAYLRQRCGEDRELLSRMEALLAADETPDGFLEEPPTILDVPACQTAPVEAAGTAIGRYRLLEKIGEGGMAVVYMAEQTEPIRRRVALKIIKLGMDTEQVIARFEAERQALAMMDHPNIAKVFDAGATEAGRPYFVMELVTGVSITEYCDANHLSTQGRLALFVQVCSAIQHAHQKGIIHRDIKPSNVMVTMHDGKPVPKVIDFGIAKATKQRLTEKTLFTRYARIIGTPAYMSPEQAELSDLDIDTRSDIYSLGVLLYELLTGSTPFSERRLREAGYVEMQRVIREEEPTKPSTKLSTLGDTLTDVARRRSCSPDLLRKALRGDLDWIVMKALEKDRTRRYDSIGALAGDVERHLRSEPVSAGPSRISYRTKKFLERHGRLVVVSIALVTLILIGLITSIALYLRAEKARAETQAVTAFLADNLLGAVYPREAKGQEVTVEYILQSASTRLDNDFTGSPLVEASIRMAVGMTYQKMSQYPAAEPHLKRATEIRVRYLGEDDPATLNSVYELARIHFALGRWAEAEGLMLQVLDTRRHTLGSEHVDTLRSLSSLGSLYIAEARFEEGLALSRETYQTACRVLGEDHEVTLAAAQSLVVGLITKADIQDAEAIVSQAYQHSRRVLGEEHATTMGLMNSYVWLHDMSGRHQAGVQLGEKALEIARRVCGPDHSTTTAAMSHLGSIYRSLNRYEEAGPLLIESGERVGHLYGQEHPITIFYQLRLAVFYLGQGEHEKCDPLLIRLMELSHKVHGPDHPQTGYIAYFLRVRAEQLEAFAQEQQSAGNHGTAQSALAKAREMREVRRRGLNRPEAVENS